MCQFEPINPCHFNEPDQYSIHEFDKIYASKCWVLDRAVCFCAVDKCNGNYTLLMVRQVEDTELLCHLSQAELQKRVRLVEDTELLCHLSQAELQKREMDRLAVMQRMQETTVPVLMEEVEGVRVLEKMAHIRLPIQMVGLFRLPMDNSIFLKGSVSARDNSTSSEHIQAAEHIDPVSNGLGSALLVRLHHFPRSNTSSTVSFSNRIPSSILSTHRAGLPLGLCPSTMVFIPDLATELPSLFEIISNQKKIAPANAAQSSGSNPAGAKGKSKKDGYNWLLFTILAVIAGILIFIVIPILLIMIVAKYSKTKSASKGKAGKQGHGKSKRGTSKSKGPRSKSSKGTKSQSKSMQSKSI
ncbi:hypothetical protein Y032_0211g2203 [Ancylostoma ceylanicum]|uniref:Uncharacterized protein n=1 Tax=Ancylostoma ceylanicum TaxID=53326 RepID=A0A016SK52_9BILA|nr:hypothetical protein Y032_0211g2203 [Ancylostoma ceylanicum]